MEAYYFYNSKTGVTTWENPLEKEPEASTATDEKTAEDYGGIDPDLAYLDPNLKYGIRPNGPGATGGFTALFNAKTGRFDADPSKSAALSNDVGRERWHKGLLFDVDTYEQQREQEIQQRIAKGLDPSQKAQRREQKLTGAQLEYFKQVRSAATCGFDLLQRTAAKRRARQISFLINDEGRESRGRAYDFLDLADPGSWCSQRSEMIWNVLYKL